MSLLVSYFGIIPLRPGSSGMDWGGDLGGSKFKFLKGQ